MTRVVRRRMGLTALLLTLTGLAAGDAGRQGMEPVVYTVSFPSPEDHLAEVQVSFSTGGRASVEVMMPVWSPGFYRVEDYAAQVLDLTARGPDGEPLGVQRLPPGRWRIETGGAARFTLSYRLLCARNFVTATGCRLSSGC